MKVGDFALVRDGVGSSVLRLARIKSIAKSELVLAVYGTRGGQVKTARFVPVYANKFNVYVGKPRASENADPWEWRISNGAIKAMIPAYGLHLTRAKHLNARSYDVFRSLSPMNMHRFGTSAKACMAEGLGGSVEPRYKSTPRGIMYQNPKYKAYRHTPYKQMNQGKSTLVWIRNKGQSKMLTAHRAGNRSKMLPAWTRSKGHSKMLRASKGRGKMLSTWTKQKGLAKRFRARSKAKGHGQKAKAWNKTRNQW